jgi:hypothetical protein
MEGRQCSATDPKADNSCEKKKVSICKVPVPSMMLFTLIPVRKCIGMVLVPYFPIPMPASI